MSETAGSSMFDGLPAEIRNKWLVPRNALIAIRMKANAIINATASDDVDAGFDPETATAIGLSCKFEQHRITNISKHFLASE